MLRQRVCFYQRILCLFYAFFLFLLPLSANASSAGETIKTIAFSKDWLALVHYQPRWIGGYKSSIDSENFFIDAAGKTNPLAELKATIDLFENTSDTEKQCLFPARYMLLKQKGLVAKPFPICAEYQSFQKDLNADGITLLYTDAYMNNPASLFGHTLMRIDIPEGKTQLVSHGMNYGAYVDEKTAGALYAIYGIAGGYYGGFTVKPYYSVINMYNNMENRDIWEYRLHLTETEKELYVAHLWEVGHTQTRYYFFTKNCSYLLMEVLDAIRPDLQLAAQFRFQTIPLDTVKAVFQREGLVSDVAYRPSRQRRIAYRYGQMNARQQKALIELLKGDSFDLVDALNEEERIFVLDSAYEYVQYLWVKQDIELADYRKLSFQILKARRDIKTASAEVVVPKESALSSHDSKRLQTVIGTKNGKAFTELVFRPAYHSLTDSPSGLLENMEINFLDTAIRFYPRHDNLKLQSLSLVKISSFAPYNALFHPVSYQIDTYIEREYNPKTHTDKLMYTLKGGSGLTGTLAPELSVYGLVNSMFRYGGGNMAHHQGVAVGASVGVLYQSKAIRFQTQGDWFISDNDMLREKSIKPQIDFSITQSLSVGASYRYKERFNRSENEFRLFFNKFF